MWQKERDLLVAQAMAFVQSVTGKPVDTAVQLETHIPSKSTGQKSADLPAAIERPADVVPAVRLSAINRGDFRDEIHRRVATFRARQQAFDRERTEYCNATIARMRAASEQTTKGHNTQPPKR
jgi:hypothetical protein